MGNYSMIEGPFAGGKFTFRKVRPEDWDKVIKHIQDYFLRDEPTSKLLGYSDQYGEEFAEFVKLLLPHDLSFWVEDNETGEVAAVRVTYRHTRDISFDGVKIECRPLKILYQLVILCNEKVNLFDHYKLEEYADFFVASCAPKYRQMGITSEMYRRSLEFLKSQGLKMAKSVFTSPYTRRAASNLGFEEIAKVDFSELKDDDGTPTFHENELNEEHYGATMCKLL